MATENIMMDGVKRGGDRQELHEAIRVHSMAADVYKRQQESCGIAVSDRGVLSVYRAMGLVSEVFDLSLIHISSP